MSIIHTSGYGYSKKLCEDITSRFLNTYFPRHNLEINIVHRGMKRDGVYGWCDISKNSKKSKPRSFLIELQSNMYKFVYTQILFHELVHVGQWVRGDLQFRQGKLCYSEVPIDNFDYRDQPHEVEAREMEKKLFVSYIDMTNEELAQVPWKLLRAPSY